MNQFIEKYHNFVVEVDQKRRYILEVTRAWYQQMPTLAEERDKGNSTPPEPVSGKNSSTIDTRKQSTVTKSNKETSSQAVKLS